MASDDADGNEISEFQQLQRANNIAKAAYAELTWLAFGEWIADYQVDESLLNKFRHTVDGKSAELSIETADVPISSMKLRSILFDTSVWRRIWPQIVHEAHSYLPSAAFQRLIERTSPEGSSQFPDEIFQKDSEWSCIINVNVRLFLPTPIVPIREYSFLRFQKRIQKGVWAIIDVSEDYCNDALSPAAELEYRRRPSGVLIKDKGYEKDSCNITWVENMEVPTLANLLWTMMCPNLAEKWVRTLSQWLKRPKSNFLVYHPEYSIQQITYPSLFECWEKQVIDRMLDLTTCLEMEFFKTISVEPNENVWSIVFDERERVMKDITGMSTLFAITSIRVSAAPSLVYGYLLQESLHLLNIGFEFNENQPNRVLKFSGGDDCIITLQRKLIEEGQRCDYLWQASQQNELCSFIMAHEMVEEEIRDMFSFRVATENGKCKSSPPCPAGFAIMPDEFGSVQLIASVVTIAIKALFDDETMAEAIERIKNLIIETREIIEEKFNN